jgi:hypothetical protein
VSGMGWGGVGWGGVGGALAVPVPWECFISRGCRSGVLSRVMPGLSGIRTHLQQNTGAHSTSHQCAPQPQTLASPRLPLLHTHNPQE